MKNFGKFLAILSVGAMTAIAPMTNANAQGFYGKNDIRDQREGIMAGDPRSFPQWQYRNGGGNQYRNGGRNYRGGARHSNRGARQYYRSQNNNNGLALGLGIAAGALALGVIANSSQTRQAPSGRLDPWTTSWYRYCDNKYRSFNASTGTYRGFDGQDHFCVAR